MDQRRLALNNGRQPVNTTLPGDSPATMYPPIVRHAVVLAAVFAVYFGLGKLGLAFSALNENATAVWPPSGYALAAFIVFGTRIWPAVLGGAFLVYFTTTGALWSSLAIGVGNTFEGLVASTLIERFADGADVFRRVQTVFRFAAIAMFSTSISATWGATSVTLLGSAAWTDYRAIWLTWWLGNLSGSLVVTPFMLLWATTPISRASMREVIEALGLVILLVLVGLVVFGGRFPTGVQTYPLEFLCVPFIIWAAFRFGQREVATAIVLLLSIAVWGTLRGYGPFVTGTPNESLVLLQAYTSVMAIMGAVLSTVVMQQKLAERQLHELAITDPLTGLANYRRLIEVLKAEIARSNRTSRPFAVLFVDMNGLKKINDRYGHLTGSRALCRVAETLRRSCRTIDTPARFGGDEFAIVLPETGDEGGRLVLKRVSDRLATDGDKPALSVSGGVAMFPRDGDSPTMLLRAADQTLYAAKGQTASSKKSKPTKRPPDELKTGTLF